MAAATGKLVGTAGLLAATVLIAEPRAFGAEETAQTPPLTVRIDDRAGVPSRILALAKSEATRIFQNIGVDVVWLDPDPPALDAQAVQDSTVVMRFLARDATDRMHTQNSMLGISAGTRFALVFYSRIEDSSLTRDPNDVGRVLGHVMAHEIGHLLLPGKTHSRSGIMQAGLDTRLAARGGLFFTPAQARIIRAKLGG